mgnify:CR=1 FL=1
MAGISNFKIRINSIKIDKVINIKIKTIHDYWLDTIKLDKNLEDIKNRVLDNTEAYIDSHRKRAPVPFKKRLIDVLRQTSYVEKIDKNTYKLGIGNKKTLDKEVPYWYIVNYGGIIGRGKAVVFKGIFQDGPPVQGGKGNTWFDGGSDADGKMYMMKPKNPIPPMHYINYAANQFQREILRFRKSMKDIKK